MNLPSMALVYQLEDVLKDAKPFREENTEKLEGLRENMLQAGFSAPFKGILQRTMDEAKDMDEAEWADLKKQVSYFRQIANMKKYSLARASIALSAHRLSSHFMKMGYSDIVEHTPLDGNHISLLMGSGAEGILAYRTIMDRFEMMADMSSCFQVKVRSGGETHVVQVEEKERIDYKVARMFGLEAEVTEVKPSLKRKPLISSKGTRVSLVSAIVNYVAKNVDAELRDGESGELKRYNDFLRGSGLRPDVRMDQVEGYEELKVEMEKEKFLERKEGGHRLAGDLAAQVGTRKKQRQEKVLERSLILLLSPMFKFYLTTPREQRKKSNLYPGMVVVPSPNQIRIFTPLYEFDRELPAPTILRKKMEVEEMGVRLDSMKLGAALLLQESGKSEEWVAEFLKMGIDEVRGSRVLLKSLEKDGRGGDFLKRIKE